MTVKSILGEAAGALSLGTGVVAFLTNTPSKRPTTRQWEAEVARTDSDKFFTLYLVLPAVLPLVRGGTHSGTLPQEK